ncbi:MAG TPA: acyltransferase [Bacteroidia bacterium]|nr:acyltransferase [Bacteroidia bacterium]HNT79679.1 acyltransferase [Bacteroidia bacterium]
MLKLALETLIKKRNPAFAFDEEADFSLLISLASNRMFALLRGLKFIFRGSHFSWLMIGKAVSIRHLSKVKIGSRVQLGDYVHLNALGQEGIQIGDNVSIGAFSRLVVSTTYNHIGKYIKIGDRVGMGEYCYLGGAGGLEIGSDCIIGQYLSCHPENHNYHSSHTLIRLQGVSRIGIKIGSNCWIGSKVTVLDGVEIGDNCVIAAGAVVTKSMPANSVIGGVPAKVIKSIGR